LFLSMAPSGGSDSVEITVASVLPGTPKGRQKEERGPIIKIGCHVTASMSPERK
jgi:hypothetical protein